MLLLGRVGISTLGTHATGAAPGTPTTVTIATGVAAPRAWTAAPRTRPLLTGATVVVATLLVTLEATTKNTVPGTSTTGTSTVMGEDATRVLWEAPVPAAAG